MQPEVMIRNQLYTLAKSLSNDFPGVLMGLLSVYGTERADVDIKDGNKSEIDMFYPVINHISEYSVILYLFHE